MEPDYTAIKYNLIDESKYEQVCRIAEKYYPKHGCFILPGDDPYGDWQTCLEELRAPGETKVAKALGWRE